MNVAKRNEYSTWRICVMIVVFAGFAGVLDQPTCGQGVSIDMPPPPRAKVVLPDPDAAARPGDVSLPVVSNLSQMQVEGRVALSRFVGARYSGTTRAPLGRNRYRSRYTYSPYSYGYHYHIPFFFHGFNFGFCW